MAIELEGERSLPTNLNGVEFITNPYAVLRNRTWPDIQKMAAVGLERFHQSSGLDCAVFIDNRFVPDRHNAPLAQMGFVFVFDGLATRVDMGALEKVMSRAPVPMSSAAVLSIPPTARPSLMVTSDGVYNIWKKDSEIPENTTLSLEEGEIQKHVWSLDTASEDDFLACPHVLGVKTPLSIKDRDLEKMKFAFAKFMSERIADASGALAERERTFLNQAFPPHVAKKLGLADNAHLTAAFAQAKAVLPTSIGYQDKLALIGLFFAVCHSDGQLSANEMRVLREAAIALGLDGREVVDYITRLW